MIAGVDLRKERRLSEVLSDAFTILFAHWQKLVIIAIPLLAASVAFGLLTIAVTPDWLAEDTADAELTNEQLEDLVPFLLVTFLSLPVLLIVTQLVSGATVVFLDQTDRGNEMDAGDALDRAQDRLGALVGSILRAIVIVFLFSITIIGIPLAINRTVKWLFISQVVMLEGKNGQEVLRTSAEIVKGRWWNTLWRWIVTGLVIGIPTSVLSQALGSAIPGILGSILSSLTVFLTGSYGIISLSLMYFDLKARRSAHDISSADREPDTESQPPRQGAGYL